jgi:metacaspase-1
LRPEEIRVVLNELATTASLLDRLHWLLDDVASGHERVLFYSGHGAQIPAYGIRDEADHYDECLVPYDFDWSPEHAVTDKQFLDLYSQLPYDSYFVAIFDCCHSGGLTREGGPRPRGIDPPDDIRHRGMRWNTEPGMWEQCVMAPTNRSLATARGGADYLGSTGATYRLGRAVALRRLPNRKYDRERRALHHHGPYLPVILEACQEQELAYEYRDGATSYGRSPFRSARCSAS